VAGLKHLNRTRPSSDVPSNAAKPKVAKDGGRERAEGGAGTAMWAPTATTEVAVRPRGGVRAMPGKSHRGQWLQKAGGGR